SIARCRYRAPDVAGAAAAHCRRERPARRGLADRLGTEAAQTSSPRIAVRAQARLASGPFIPGQAQMDLEVGRGQRRARLLRPFDQADRIAAEVVEKARIDPILVTFEAIKIKVIEV